MKMERQEGSNDMKPKCLFLWIVKWVFLALLCGATIATTLKAKESSREQLSYEADADEQKSAFEVLCGLFMFQVPMFLLIRPVAFLIWSILTCFCDPKDDIGDGPYDDSYIHYDYDPDRQRPINRQGTVVDQV